jgi:hypothetical protein
LDGDGVTDLVIGAPLDDTGRIDRGALYVLLLNTSGMVKSSTKIASGTGGDSTLASYGEFGGSLASLGDLDGDGVTDLAVGAPLDDTGGLDRGAVHVLFLKALTITDFGDGPDTGAGTATWKLSNAANQQRPAPHHYGVANGVVFGRWCGW